MQENFLKTINTTYKLLDFFPEGDPLKNRAKERALLIMEKLTLDAVSSGLMDDILVLESYLELGKYQGWIDTVNFLIIKKEYQLIEASLQKQITNYKSQIPNKFRIQNSKVQNFKNDEISDTQLRHKEIAPKNAENYSVRQGKILRILAQKENAQVQDIIKEMPDITKRTIRRDLDDLLKKGRITRIGEFNQIFYQNTNRT